MLFIKDSFKDMLYALYTKSITYTYPNPRYKPPQPDRLVYSCIHTNQNNIKSSKYCPECGMFRNSTIIKDILYPETLSKTKTVLNDNGIIVFDNNIKFLDETDDLGRYYTEEEKLKYAEYALLNKIETDGSILINNVRYNVILPEKHICEWTYQESEYNIDNLKIAILIEGEDENEYVEWNDFEKMYKVVKKLCEDSNNYFSKEDVEYSKDINNLKKYMANKYY